MLPFIKGGKLRALGVTGAKRSQELPEVPTIAEAGVPGYEMVAWIGMAGPKGMTRDLQLRVHGELLRVLKNAEVQKSLRVAGHEIAYQDSPERFFEFMKSEAAKWARVAQDSGARVE
jgi:tripartite-type tricarboxylate transporter receptor subunit TctC